MRTVAVEFECARGSLIGADHNESVDSSVWWGLALMPWILSRSWITRVHRRRVFWTHQAPRDINGFRDGWLLRLFHLVYSWLAIFSVSMSGDNLRRKYVVLRCMYIYMYWNGTVE